MASGEAEIWEDIQVTLSLCIQGNRNLFLLKCQQPPSKPEACITSEWLYGGSSVFPVAVFVKLMFVSDRQDHTKRKYQQEKAGSVESFLS